jgi:FKBP-type peptidyl-prolyl cis-trans isomerase
MKIKLQNIVFIGLLCIAASSCIKEKLETTYKKQESQIDSYLSKSNTAKRDSTIVYEDGTTKDTTWTENLEIVYNKGAARLITKKGTGPQLSEDGAVSFYYAGYVFKGSAPSPATLFATNHQTTAETSRFEVTDADYSLFEVNMAETEILEGLRDGLVGVRSGEECEILFTAKYGYGNRTFGIIPANSALLYRIWVVGVSND